MPIWLSENVLVLSSQQSGQHVIDGDAFSLLSTRTETHPDMSFEIASAGESLAAVPAGERLLVRMRADVSPEVCRQVVG